MCLSSSIYVYATSLLSLCLCLLSLPLRLQITEWWRLTAPKSLLSSSHTSGLEHQSGRTKEKWWWVGVMSVNITHVCLELSLGANKMDLNVNQSVICGVGLCSSLPLADSQNEWGQRTCGDLLCCRPELQCLRRVFTLQNQWVTQQPHLPPFVFVAFIYCQY